MYIAILRGRNSIVPLFGIFKLYKASIHHLLRTNRKFFWGDVISIDCLKQGFVLSVSTLC